jgi:hypothetical protein
MPVPLIKARGQPRRMIEIKIHCLAASPECGEWHGAKPCRMIPFRITPGGWAGKVLETPPPVEFSSFWVGGWEGCWHKTEGLKFLPWVPVAGWLMTFEIFQPIGESMAMPVEMPSSRSEGLLVSRSFIDHNVIWQELCFGIFLDLVGQHLEQCNFFRKIGEMLADAGLKFFPWVYFKTESNPGR